MAGDLERSALRLSGGQQQRLCIARALAAEPEVLLLDEPCSALDPISTATIEELIVGLRESVAIVIVTHNLQQAFRVADHVAFMHLGELVEYGTSEQVFDNPRQAAHARSTSAERSGERAGACPPMSGPSRTFALASDRGIRLAEKECVPDCVGDAARGPDGRRLLRLRDNTGKERGARTPGQAHEDRPARRVGHQGEPERAGLGQRRGALKRRNGRGRGAAQHLRTRARATRRSR